MFIAAAFLSVQVFPEMETTTMLSNTELIALRIARVALLI